MSSHIQTYFVLSLVLFAGCRKPTVPGLDSALASTNVLFTPYRQEPIPMAHAQAQALREIVRKFGNQSEVRLEKSMPAVPTGLFVMGDTTFGWFGGYLEFEDEKKKRYLVIEDKRLVKLQDSFNAAEGSVALQSPSRYPSRDEWKRILKTLE